MPLRLQWVHPSIAVTAGSIPEWGLLVENPEVAKAEWTGAPLVGVCILRAQSGEPFVGSGQSLAIPAVAMHHSLQPGEARPVYLTLDHVSDDDLRSLEAGSYKVAVEYCTIPLPVELPGALNVTVAALANDRNSPAKG